MQTHFIPVDKRQVAVAKGQIANYLPLYLFAGAWLSTLTLWMLGYRLAAAC